MLGILGFIFILVAPFLVYRSAKQNGWSPVFWPILTFVVGFGIQIVLPILIVMILGIYWIATGDSSELEIQKDLETPSIIIGIAGLVLSVAAVMWIMSRVGRINDKNDGTFGGPPTPPMFE